MSMTYKERKEIKERFKKDFYSVKKRPFVDIPEEYKKKTEEFNKEYVDCKKAEIEKMKHNDNQQLYKRATTGRLAECAVEIYLHKNFTDWTIGKSEDYNYADLEPGGLPIGVKCSSFGNYPTFDPDTTEPQIICIRLSVEKEKKERIFILGLASPEILREYSDINLILDDNLREKKKPNGNYAKTAFYGFKHLVPFKTENDIKNFIKQIN